MSGDTPENNNISIAHCDDSLGHRKIIQMAMKDDSLSLIMGLFVSWCSVRNQGLGLIDYDQRFVEECIFKGRLSEPESETNFHGSWSVFSLWTESGVNLELIYGAEVYNRLIKEIEEGWSLEPIKLKRLFIDSKEAGITSVEDAKEIAPWAVEIIEDEGGFYAFESIREADFWQRSEEGKKLLGRRRSLCGCSRCLKKSVHSEVA